MRFSAIAVYVIFVGLVLLSGCTNARTRNPRSLSVSVAITPIGASSLSTEQVARIHEAVKPELLRAGYTFAQTSSSADLVLLVSFTPVAGGSGGRVKVTGLEPTAQFRRATAGGDTPEANEMRRRQREFEQWLERQNRAYEY